MNTVAFVAQSRLLHVSAASFIAPEEIGSARVRCPKQPLSDFFYSLVETVQKLFSAPARHG